MPDKVRRWKRALQESDKPTYLALADAIAEDIRGGRLSAMDRLPPLRTLAAELELHYTTAARGYAEAQARGLIDSKAGQGTFIRATTAALSSRSVRNVGLVEMTMNLPPEPEDGTLQARLRRGFTQLAEHEDLPTLLRYQEFGGSAEDRDAGARWLAPLLPGVLMDQLLVCPGIQSGLVALFSTLVRPGEVMCCEEITYPGVKALSAQFGIRLHGLPMDAEGIVPQELEAACRLHRPKVLYCNPTYQNPTTMTMSPARRDTIAAIARQYGLTIIEDDAYGLLPTSPIAPIATRAPELTYYLSGLAKHLGAGLRIAYLVAPDVRAAKRLTSTLRVTTIMAAPLTVSLATRWINDGSADQVLHAIRRESQARQKLAAELLPIEDCATQPDAFHLWLKLPPPWNRGEFANYLRARGVGVVGSDAFTVSSTPLEAVRVCLGGVATRRECRHSLELIAEALDQLPEVASSVF
ncbi:PLP-dependent aminotransferase family protein [Solimonas marina]|uniref:PLP-dependent aminotransferase family protein n=1 Tax=Solimonas marina TaxID=2714601 RepID=A0A969WBD6_9GAMM|nr:PLP-dependent aminotransferase family protein [Solimonas marina]NKF23059.1 PLP-dependent aminotransferase family protein [Solimonas marina]